MSSSFAGRTVSLALSFAAMMVFSLPALAASPEIALAKPAASAKQAPVVLPAELRRVGPIAGPTPKPLAGFVAKPIKYVRAVAPRPVGPVETAESRSQLLFLVDHRNLNRGPGSLVYMVGNVKPIAAVQQTEVATVVAPIFYARPL